MSSKHKKARKNPKEFKPRPPKSSRDPLTGLYVDVGGEKIYSDRIYNQDTSPLHKRLLEHDSIEVEYELGKNAIIITTGMYDYDGGGTPEEVAEHPTSHTGRYLKQVLEQHPPQPIAA